MKKLMPTPNKYAILFFSCLEVFLTSGIILGWPSFTKMLEYEKVFFSLCTNNATALNMTVYPCPETDIEFSNIFSAGMAGIFLYFFMGVGLDYIGPRLFAMINHLVVFGSLLGIAVSDEELNLFYPSAVALYVSGLSVMTANMHNSLLFPAFSGTIQAVYVGMFTVGSMIFSVGLVLMEQFGLSRLHFTLGLAAGQILCLFIAYLNGFDRPFKKAETVYDNPKYYCFQFQKPALKLKKSIGATLSVKFIYTVFYFCFTGLVSNLFITTVNAQIENIARTQTEALLSLDIYYVIFPVSAIFIPLSGRIIDWHISASLGICLIMMLTYLVFLSFPVWIEQQIVTYILFSLSRPFIFASTFAVLKEFGFDIFGRLTGIAYIFFGAFSFLQFPLVEFTYSLFDGNYFYMNLFCGILLLPILPYPIYYSYQKRRSNYEQI